MGEAITTMIPLHNNTSHVLCLQTRDTVAAALAAALAADPGFMAKPLAQLNREAAALHKGGDLVRD